MQINTDTTGLIGITLMLISLIAQPLRSAKALSLRNRVGLLIGMAVILSIPLPSFGLSPAGFVRGITGDLSIATLVLLALALVRALAGCSFVEEQSRMAALRVFWIVAAGFYPLALGFGMFDPYRMGYGNLWFMGALLGLAVLASLRYSALLALCISLAVAAWSIGWYESTNLWDYLLDPWLAIYALAVQIKHWLIKIGFFVRKLFNPLPPLPADGSLRSSGVPTGVPLAGEKGDSVQMENLELNDER